MSGDSGALSPVRPASDLNCKTRHFLRVFEIKSDTWQRVAHPVDKVFLVRGPQNAANLIPIHHMEHALHHSSFVTSIRTAQDGVAILFDFRQRCNSLAASADSGRFQPPTRMRHKRNDQNGPVNCDSDKQKLTTTDWTMNHHPTHGPSTSNSIPVSPVSQVCQAIKPSKQFSYKLQPQQLRSKFNHTFTQSTYTNHITLHHSS